MGFSHQELLHHLNHQQDIHQQYPGNTPLPLYERCCGFSIMLKIGIYILMAVTQKKSRGRYIYSIKLIFLLLRSYCELHTAYSPAAQTAKDTHSLLFRSYMQ